MIVTLLGLWCMMLLAGDTPIGRMLRRCLVEWPAERLGRIDRGAVLVWVILGIGGAVLFALLQDEGLRLYTMALPELAGWVSTFEIGALVDALTAVLVTISMVRVQAVRGWIASRIARRSHASRAPRMRRPERIANDEEEGPSALAA